MPLLTGPAPGAVGHALHGDDLDVVLNRQSDEEVPMKSTAKHKHEEPTTMIEGGSIERNLRGSQNRDQCDPRRHPGEGPKESRQPAGVGKRTAAAAKGR